jgi:hypothetical protein
VALEHYYKVARNTEAEWKVAEICVRAERRVGQLLKEMEATGERASKGRLEKEMSTDSTFGGVPQFT